MDFRSLEKKAKSHAYKTRYKQIEQEEERIIKAEKNEDPYLHTIILLTLAGICVILTLVFALERVPYAGILFWCGVVGPIALAGLINFLIHRTKARNRVPPPQLKSLQPSQTIPPLLTHQIDELKNELIGKTSRLSNTKQELEEINARARKAREQLELRCSQNNALYLKQSLDHAQEVIDRTNQVLEELKVFQAKVEAFIQECRTTVEHIKPELRDIELVREVNELRTRTSELEEQAESCVAEVINNLIQRMLGVRTDVISRFVGSGIRLSLEPKDKEPLASLSELEQRIASFHPRVKAKSTESTTNT